MKLVNKLQLLKSPILWRIIATAGLFLVIALLAYNRYPTYFDAPSFYAEDGTVFAKNIIDKGFWGAALTPFNGYLVVGLYLLEGLGFALNTIQHGGNFLDLPQALSVVSYGFWAFLCTLPVMLFWHDVKRKSLLFLTAVSLALLPLPAFNYAILGTIGNYKFAFLFIAFLLIIKRWRLPQASKLVYVVDAGLALCLLTNATVYVLLPFALVPYWPGRKKLRLDYLKTLFRNKSFVSLLVVSGIALAQLTFIAMRGGVDELAGYLQEPYEFAKTIEIVLHRTLLFPFDHFMAKHLTDSIVVLATLALVLFLWKIARPEDRPILVFGLWTALAATTLFVSQRTGISQLFGGYASSSTDHFFYAQNLVFLFTALYIASRRIDIVQSKRWRSLACIVLALVPLAAIVNNDVGSSALMNRATGPLWYATQQACRTTQLDPLKVPIYPVGAVELLLNRQQYCTNKTDKYIPARQPLPLVPIGDHRIIGSEKLSQTFTAHYDQLQGISIFFATFGGGSTSKYQLQLMDARCQEVLRTTTFSALPLEDNAYADIRFQTIPDSKDTQYCFTVTAQTLVPNTQPLAVSLSEPNIYPQETARKDGIDLPEDLIFDVLYKPRTP